MKQKIKNSFALLRCAFVYIGGKTATKKPADLNRILVVQNAKLGDMVCTTPMFRAIKEKYPRSEVWVLGNAINKELLAGHPDVDNYIVYEHQKDIDVLISEAKLWHIDAACMTGPEHRLLSVLYLAGVPLIVVPKIEGGPSPYETVFYKLLRHVAVVVPHRIGSYAPREYLRLLEPLGIQIAGKDGVRGTDTKKHLTYSPEAAKKIDEFFRKNGVSSSTDFLVGISPSVGNKIKTWPAERFAEVAEYASEKYGAKIVIVGGSRDATEVEETIKHLTVPVTNACNAFSIDELKAAIAHMKIFIAVDTGPIYIAEAFNVPTIDIVGPMDEREQPPFSDIHRIVIAKRDKPELHIMNAQGYDYAEARRQTEAITVAMVIAEFDELARVLGKKKI